MVILSVIIGLFVFWLFTSSSKSDDVKKAIKFSKDTLNETDRFLGDVNDSIRRLGDETQEYKLQTIKNSLIHLSELEDIEGINNSAAEIGLDGISEDVTSYVEEFKKAGRFEEISHLVIKIDSSHPKLDKNYRSRLSTSKERYSQSNLNL